MINFLILLSFSVKNKKSEDHQRHSSFQSTEAEHGSADQLRAELGVWVEHFSIVAGSRVAGALGHVIREVSGSEAADVVGEEVRRIISIVLLSGTICYELPIADIQFISALSFALVRAIDHAAVPRDPDHHWLLFLIKGGVEEGLRVAAVLRKAGLVLRGLSEQAGRANMIVVGERRVRMAQTCLGRNGAF